MVRAAVWISRNAGSWVSGEPPAEYVVPVVEEAVVVEAGVAGVMGVAGVLGVPGVLGVAGVLGDNGHRSRLGLCGPPSSSDASEGFFGGAATVLLRLGTRKMGSSVLAEWCWVFDRTSDLKVEKPGVRGTTSGVCGGVMMTIGSFDAVASFLSPMVWVETWCSFRATVRVICRPFLASRLDVYSKTGLKEDGR